VDIHNKKCEDCALKAASFGLADGADGAGTTRAAAAAPSAPRSARTVALPLHARMGIWWGWGEGRRDPPPRCAR
jgi:hypothetical protein